MMEIKRMRDIVNQLLAFARDEQLDADRFSTECIVGLEQLRILLDHVELPARPAQVEPNEREKQLAMEHALRMPDEPIAALLARYGAELKQGFAEWSRLVDRRVQGMEQKLAELEGKL